MPYLIVMDTRRLKVWWILLAIPFLIGCPLGEEKCPFNDWERITTIEDLFKISPIKDTFFVGEKLKLSISIPDSVYMWDRGVSLINETYDFSPIILKTQKIDYLNLFDNHMEFIFGNKGEGRNRFQLEYQSEEQLFKLEVILKFENSGNYSIRAGESRIFFGNQKECTWFEIRTNIKEFEKGDYYEFTVIP